MPGNEPRGVDTGIDLRAGDQVTVTATGNITAGQRAGVVSPDGGRPGASSVFGVSRRPLPTVGASGVRVERLSEISPKSRHRSSRRSKDLRRRYGSIHLKPCDFDCCWKISFL